MPTDPSASHTEARSPAAYWQTEISNVTDTKVYIRGYDLEDLIGEVSFSVAAYLLIKGHVPSPSQAKVLDTVLTAVLDYGLQKPGTLAARYAVSANPSMAVGMAAAAMSVGTHTLATEDTARFIVQCHAEFEAGDLSAEDFAEQKVAELRAAKRRIPGLGHPVFKKVDPRAALLKRVADEEGCWTPAAELYEQIHRAFAALPGKADIPINDVGIMAAVLVALGFTPEETTGLAILSTMPGVIAHVSEELTTGRPIRIAPAQTVNYQAETGRNITTDREEAGWPSGS